MRRLTMLTTHILIIWTTAAALGCATGHALQPVMLPWGILP